MPSYAKGPSAAAPSGTLRPAYSPTSPGYPSPEEHRACRDRALLLMRHIGNRLREEVRVECVYGVLERDNVSRDVTEFFQLLVEGTDSQINQVTQSALNDPGECPDLLLILEIIADAMDNPANGCDKPNLLPWVLGAGAIAVFGVIVWKRRRDQ